MQSSQFNTNNLESTPLQYLKGVGPHIAQLLGRSGIDSIQDLIFNLPLRYEDRTKYKYISELNNGDTVLIKGQIVNKKVKKGRFAKGSTLEIHIKDGKEILIAKWFHFNKGIEESLVENSFILVFAEVRYYNFEKETIHPEIINISENDFELDFTQGPDSSPHYGKIVPIYSEIKGITPKRLRNIHHLALMNFDKAIYDFVPKAILEKYHLPNLKDTLHFVHYPPSDYSLDRLNDHNSAFHKRIIFDELFLFELLLAKHRQKEKELTTHTLKIDESTIKDFIKKLPFTLTNAQTRVFEEIKKDLASDSPMHRLVQGDVGSGKTMIAILASLIAIENNRQVAIMAPTEILAEQHANNFIKFFDSENIILLTGSTKNKIRKEIQAKLESDQPIIAIGTHALFQEDIKFKNLALVVIDEQHRFGVRQRLELKQKGHKPHMIVMTATPIPRTLSITAYGDLDLSIIDELPPGRLPVKTTSIRGEDENYAYKLIKDELERGRQCYIVYPLINESEKMDLEHAIEGSQKIAKLFPYYKVSLLHGQMSNAEKQSILEEFRTKKSNILVSTTVIEVGIDIPNATIMIIENAERFGLSQLHQLRGRVGRGGNESFCILINRSKNTSETIAKRLKAMEQTNDGFKISEIDLEIRGPGEYMGTRQSGLTDFKFADIVKHIKILEAARKEAFDIIENDNNLESKDNSTLKILVDKEYKKRGELIRTG